MRSVGALERGVCASVLGPMLWRVIPPAAAIVALVVPQSALAQQSQGPGALPEIVVIGTAPLPPVRRSPAAPGKPSANAPAAGPQPAPAASAGGAGAIDREKIPATAP